MASRRTKSISTKVTPEEFARIQTLAGDQPVSESVRAVLLKASGPSAVDTTVLAEVLALRTMFPDRVNENPFFTEGPRRIFAHLLTFRPTAEELASWLRHDEELDRRVHGTPYASIIDRQAPAQRGGVLAALNLVADVEAASA